jgi:hypothetical protein
MKQKLKIHITEAPTAAPGKKICPRCHEEKPEDAFYRAGVGSARRMPYCIECDKAIKKARKEATG